MTKPILTQSRLREALRYLPDVGLFIWVKHIKSTEIGEVAGSNHICGYSTIRINYKAYLSHRLAFLYMTGEFPLQVDHINHIRNDNRWCNLRPANATINQQNVSIGRNNTSGVTGVHSLVDNKKWRSTIYANGTKHELGCFDDIKDAAKARKEAEIRYGFHPNHGK